MTTPAPEHDEAVDLLQLVLRLVDDEAERDRLRTDPDAILRTQLHDHLGTTGEDVAAVAEVVRRRRPASGERIEVREPVRPVGDESPRDAALRLLVGLCDALDGTAVEPVTLPHREHPPDPPMPRQVARGGGEPVPTEPPGGRWLHPVVPDDPAPDPG